VETYTGLEESFPPEKLGKETVRHVEAEEEFGKRLESVGSGVFPAQHVTEQERSNI